MALESKSGSAVKGILVAAVVRAWLSFSEVIRHMQRLPFLSQKTQKPKFKTPNSGCCGSGSWFLLLALGREVRKREQECSAQQVQAKGCGSLGLKARREGAGQREQDHQHWEKADCRKEKKGK